MKNNENLMGWLLACLIFGTAVLCALYLTWLGPTPREREYVSELCAEQKVLSDRCIEFKSNGWIE